jgi:glycosyltransferase involved in cell wall biosynthesis
MSIAPLQPLPPSELVAQWPSRGEHEPVCSILVPTFRHKKYLSDALNGILAQRTVFPFEVIVRDDCSDDGTREIAEDFCRRYPGVVFLIAKERRTYPHESTVRELQLRARGRFIAICEGDDYWTDQDKLQTQISALKADETAVLAFHESVILNQSEPAQNVRNLVPELSPGMRWSGSADERALETVPFRSVLYRAIPQALVPERYAGHLWTEDTFLTVRLSLQGAFLYLPGILPSVYRRHESNLTTEIKERPVFRAGRKAQTFLAIADYLLERNRPSLAEHFIGKAHGQVSSISPQRRRNCLRRALVTIARTRRERCSVA